MGDRVVWKREAMKIIKHLIAFALGWLAAWVGYYVREYFKP